MIIWEMIGSFGKYQSKGVLVTYFIDIEIAFWNWNPVARQTVEENLQQNKDTCAGDYEQAVWIIAVTG